MNAGLAKVISIPLQDIHPNGGPYKTKKGNQNPTFAFFLCNYVDAVLARSFKS